MLSMLFTYLFIIWRSDWDTTKFETMVIPELSGWMKSTITLDLTFFKALLMLAICSFADVKILSMLTLFIGMITCFLNGPFVVIFNQGSILSWLLMILWILSIFFAERLGNLSLSFRISEMLEPVAWAYDFLTLELVIFLELLTLLKNLDFSKTFLGRYVEMGREFGNFCFFAFQTL